MFKSCPMPIVYAWGLKHCWFVMAAGGSFLEMSLLVWWSKKYGEQPASFMPLFTWEDNCRSGNCRVSHSPKMSKTPFYPS